MGRTGNGTVLPDALVALLRQQYGLVRSSQLCAELDAAERRRLRRERDLEVLTPRVLRHRAASVTREQELLAAVFDGGDGAALWGKSAASFWGFGRLRSARPHVGVARTTVRGSRLGHVHKLRHLDDDAFTIHRDIPIARPEEVIFWLAGMWTHRFGQAGLDLAVERTGRTIDHAWRLGLIDGRRIHRLCAEGGGRGRSGIVVMREVLAGRPPDYRPSGSALEDRFESVLPQSLRGDLERQVAVGGEVLIGVVDYRHRHRPLIVEINGEVFHSSISDRQHDEQRYRRLVDAGFEVLIVWEHDIFHDPSTVVAALRRVLAGPVRPRVLRPTNAPWEAW